MPHEPELISVVPTEPAPCSPAAERMRRHRQRRRSGMRCLTIELHETEIDALICRGFLNTEMRNDLSAVYEAIYAFFDATLGSAP